MDITTGLSSAGFVSLALILYKLSKHYFINSSCRIDTNQIRDDLNNQLEQHKNDLENKIIERIETELAAKMNAIEKGETKE